ncbi:hypothetical protein Tco_1239191 [Tanacetum coccineum]
MVNIRSKATDYSGMLVAMGSRCGRAKDVNNKWVMLEEEIIKDRCDIKQKRNTPLEKSLNQAISGQQEVMMTNNNELQKAKEVIDDLNRKVVSLRSTIDAKNVELLNLQTAFGQYYAEIEAKEHLERELASAREESVRLSKRLEVGACSCDNIMLTLDLVFGITVLAHKHYALDNLWQCSLMALDVCFIMPLCHSKVEQDTAEDLIELSDIKRHSVGMVKCKEVRSIDNLQVHDFF